MTKSILVVDDSPTVRKFVAVSLSMQGYKIVMASDGMDAMERLPKQTIDLVITDLNMPHMDGFELIRTLRETPAYKEIPIIILSSLGDQITRERAREYGADSFVNKPFSLEKIQYEVSKYLGCSENA